MAYGGSSLIPRGEFEIVPYAEESRRGDFDRSEVLACFLWPDDISADSLSGDEALADGVGEELADVVIYCLGLASTPGVDLEEVIEKQAANE